MVAKPHPLRSDRRSVADKQPQPEFLGAQLRPIVFQGNPILWADKPEIIGKTEGISSSGKVLRSLLLP